MKTYRFVTKTHQDVLAETLEEAVKAFEEMRQAGLTPKLETVSRIEVEDEEGEYIPIDRPLRAEYQTAPEEAHGGLAH